MTWLSHFLISIFLSFFSSFLAFSQVLGTKNERADAGPGVTHVDTVIFSALDHDRTEAFFPWGTIELDEVPSG